MRVTLGDNPDLMPRLRKRLKELGAELVNKDGDWPGSDFATTTLLVDGQPLIVDEDIWLGVSIDGPDELVRSIQSAVAA
jgi:hypothetical protein